MISKQAFLYSQEDRLYHELGEKRILKDFVQQQGLIEPPINVFGGLY